MSEPHVNPPPLSVSLEELAGDGTAEAPYHFPAGTRTADYLAAAGRDSAAMSFVQIAGTAYPFLPLDTDAAGRALWDLDHGELVDRLEAVMAVYTEAMPTVIRDRIEHRMRDAADPLDLAECTRCARAILAATPDAVPTPPPPAEITDAQLFALMGSEVPVPSCEYCTAVGALNLCQVTPFKLNPASSLTMTYFRVCDSCAELVAAGRWPDLLSRVGFGTGLCAGYLAEMLDLYAANFTGTITREHA